jgi:hypothetical protein
VVGELAVGRVQVGGDLADHVPGVGQGLADAVDELGVAHLAGLGAFQQGGGDIQRHGDSSNDMTGCYEASTDSAAGPRVNSGST